MMDVLDLLAQWVQAGALVALAVVGVWWWRREIARQRWLDATLAQREQQAAREGGAGPAPRQPTWADSI